MKREFVETRDNISVCVPRDLNQITNYVLKEQRDWFEPEMNFIRSFLRPGDCAIDIGANFGVYTLMMAHCVGSSGHIWAVEPTAETFACLSESIKKNKFENVTLLQEGLSNRSGVATLYIGTSPELNTFTLESDRSTGNTEQVQLRTLDESVATHNISNVSFVKMDAEGEEERILECATKFLKNESPLWMFEYKNGPTVNKDLIQRFRDLGMGTYLYIPGAGGLVPIGDDPLDSFVLNLFACPNNRAQMLADRNLLCQSLPERAPDAKLNAWDNYAKQFPYSKALQGALQFQSEVYRHALNDYALAKSDSTLSVGQKYRLLERALGHVVTALKEKSTISRCQTFARIAVELRHRLAAVEVLASVIEVLVSGETVDISEPFLCASDQYDYVDPENKFAEWCMCALLAEQERQRSHSSYFLGPASLKQLEAVVEFGFPTDETKRRIELIRKRYSL